MKIYKSTGVIPSKFIERPDLFFEYLHARKWINKSRIPKKGKLDVEATAKNIGIPLRHDLTGLKGEYAVIEGLIEGLGVEKGKRPIAIRIKPNAKNPRLTFAHEVGHYFLDIVGGYPNYHPDQAVEDFCDYFASKLLED